MASNWSIAYNTTLNIQNYLFMSPALSTAKPFFCFTAVSISFVRKQIRIHRSTKGSEVLQHDAIIHVARIGISSMYPRKRQK